MLTVGKGRRKLEFIVAGETRTMCFLKHFHFILTVVLQGSPSSSIYMDMKNKSKGDRDRNIPKSPSKPLHEDAILA
jgi:hypothetical protein